MSARLAETWSLESFLAWEAEQELKHEFDGREPIAMAGGSREHASLQTNLAIAVGGRLRRQPCRFFGSDLKFNTAAGTSRYPDGMVACPPFPDDRNTIDRPIVVFEILRDSTASSDRIDKMTEYRATPSVRRYVMLEQAHAQATVFARTDTGDWVGHILGSGETLDMPEIDVSVPLDELYEGIITADRPAPTP